jgi:L-asparaginase/Glu-tRNA(Gln) amidotransferase subunit D
MRKGIAIRSIGLGSSRVKTFYARERCGGDGVVVDVTRRVERERVGKLKTGPKQRDSMRKL